MKFLSFSHFVVLSFLVFSNLLLKAQHPIQVQLLDSGWRLYEKGNFAQAKKMNDASIRMSRIANDFNTAAKGFINNGTIAFVEGDFNAALLFYDSSYQLYALLADTIQAVHALRNKALTSRRLSFYGQGIHFCNQALSLLPSSRHGDLKAQVLNTLATLFESTNNLEYSRKMLRQALALTAQSDQSYLYTNLGNTYFKLGKIDSAISCYRAALPLTVDMLQRGLILNNLGESYIVADSVAHAYSALTESLDIRKTRDSLSLISNYNNLAQLSIRQNKLKQAEQYLSKVANELIKIPNEREGLKFFQLQKSYFKNTGQFQKALKFDALYDSLNHKIFEEERIKVNELQNAYDLSERDRQLALERQTLKLRVAELEQKTFLNQLITSGGVILLMIAILLFYLYRLNSRLRYKNEILIHEQNHRVKNNLQMIASLLSIQSSSQSDATIRTVLSQNEHRIQSVALLHRMLYTADLSSTVSLRQYIYDLTNELKHALGAREASFHVKTEIESLPIENTISLGLIINELITNSVKYASSGNALQVSISLVEKEKVGELQYADNGNNFEPTSFLESDRFGARLISIQTKQLKGKYNISDKGGFYFVLSFPIQKS